MRNTQYSIASRSFANAHAPIIHALLDEIGAVDTWARDKVPAVATQLSPLVGLGAPTRAGVPPDLNVAVVLRRPKPASRTHDAQAAFSSAPLAGAV